MSTFKANGLTVDSKLTGKHNVRVEAAEARGQAIGKGRQWLIATVYLFFVSNLVVFALLVLMASLRDPLLLPGSTPRWEVLANAAGIRYWFFPSLMFLWSAIWCALEGRVTVMRYAGTAVLLLTTVGLVRKWIYPPWPESHFSAEVERFNQLKVGEHMVFPVYDPGGRTMELIKR